MPLQLVQKTAFLAATLAIAWACSSPTELCGCPPARTTLEIIGTLQDALGAPIADQSLAIESTSEVYHSFATTAGVRTDATGAFSARLYSMESPAVHSVVARIIRTAPNDTILIPVGSASFKPEGQAPDTMRVTLRLP